MQTEKRIKQPKDKTMIKRTGILTLCIMLSACTHGGGGSDVGNCTTCTPGKSAYDIWLAQGNTGTEQDFLNSLVQPSASAYDIWLAQGNTGTEQDFLDSLVQPGDNLERFAETKTEIPWEGHDSYTKHTWRSHTDNYNTYEIPATTVNTSYIKKLALGSYNVDSRVIVTDIDNDLPTVGFSSNISINPDARRINPKDGSVFKGTTLAYAHQGSTLYTAFHPLKGEATFTYDPKTPELKLEFDDYYTMTIQKQSGYPTRHIIHIEGENSTGKSRLDLKTGDFSQSVSYYSKMWQPTYVSDGQTEEVFGTYHLDLESTNIDYNSAMTEDGPQGMTTWVGITGAYGATKQ